jgi:peptidoglycan lytic transglycosylase A
MYRRLRYAVVTAAVVTPLLGLPGHGAERARAQLAARSLEPTTNQSPAEPLRLPDSALEPIDWNSLDGWAADDHAAAFATFLASCRPMLRTILPQSETRPMYFNRFHFISL